LLHVIFGGSHVSQPHIRVFRVDGRHLVDAVHELGDTEKSERKRNQFNPVIEMRHSKSKTLCARFQIGSDDAKHETEDGHCNTLQRRAARKRRAGEQAKQHQRADFRRSKLERNPHQHGGKKDHLRDAP
jgi:hypothetical protein